jgi:hypothetical protein
MDAAARMLEMIRLFRRGRTLPADIRKAQVQMAIAIAREMVAALPNQQKS